MRAKLTGCRRGRSRPSLDPPPVFAGAGPATWHDLDEPEPTTPQNLDQYDREPVGTRPAGANRGQLGQMGQVSYPFPRAHGSGWEVPL